MQEQDVGNTCKLATIKQYSDTEKVLATQAVSKAIITTGSCWSFQNNIHSIVLNSLQVIGQSFGAKMPHQTTIGKVWYTKALYNNIQTLVDI